MRFTIKAKLALAFGLILTLFGAAGYFSISSLSGSNDRMQSFAAKPFTQVQRVAQLESKAVIGARLFLRAMAVPADAERLKLQTDFQANDAQFQAVLKEYLSNTAPEERGRVQGLADGWTRLVTAGKSGLDLAVKNGNNHANDLVGGDFSQAADAMTKAVTAVGERAGVDPKLVNGGRAIELALAYERRDVYRLAAEDDETHLKKLNDEFETSMKTLDEQIQNFSDAVRKAGFVAEANTIVDAWKSFEAPARQAAALGVANTDAKANVIYVGPFSEADGVVMSEAAKLKAYEGTVAETFVADTQHSFESARTMMIALVLGAIVLGIGMALWMAISISSGLAKAVSVARSVANGDLTQDVKVTGRDEIADLLHTIQEMASKLRSIVAEVTMAAQNVASGSEELSSSAGQLSQGATEQASAAEEASSSMEEMASNVKQNAENAGQTETIARRSAADAEASGVAVGRAVDAMQIIASKINIVQEIARQTDLLALNAAVEAARAGEHGRGFAVVASEVRKLAERSQAAAAEIGTLSADTVKVARQAGEMLSKLVPDIKKTAALVEEITAACREQDVGSAQINQAIQQLDKVTQQNAAASEQVSSTSEELSSQAEQLQETIAFFRLDAHRPAVESKIDRAAKELKARTAKLSRPVAAKKGSAPKLASKAKRGGFSFEMADADQDEADADFRRAG